MRDEHAQAGEMDCARAQRFEKCWPAPGSSGDPDAVVGGALGESELLHTVMAPKRQRCSGSGGKRRPSAETCQAQLQQHNCNSTNEIDFSNPEARRDQALAP